MGGEDPIGSAVKDVLDVGQDLIYKPASGIARGIGLTGVADGIDGLHKFTSGLEHKVTDMATGEDKRLKQKADDANAANENRQRVAAGEAKKKADADAFAASEKDRMAVGSGARTLLTGPSGLEDSSEDGYTLSRKTLKGS